MPSAKITTVFLLPSHDETTTSTLEEKLKAIATILDVDTFESGDLAVFEKRENPLPVVAGWFA